MNMFFHCVEFLGVVLLSGLSIKCGHWCLAIFILIIGGTMCQSNFPEIPEGYKFVIRKKVNNDNEDDYNEEL